MKIQTSVQQNDPENVVNSRYFDNDEIQSLKFSQKGNSLSLLHINACSLSKHFDDLVYLLKCTNKNFDIIAVSETRISKKASLTSNINLNNYSFETTPTELTIGETMLYISIACLINHKLTLICIKNQLESTFFEIINSKMSNMVVGCVYKHPNMDVLDFNSLINQLLDKISKEQKQIFLLEDFNINLLNYKEHQLTNEFLDYLASILSFHIFCCQQGLLVILKPSLTIFFPMYFHLKQYLETLLQLYLIIYPSFCLLPMCFQILYAINQKYWREIFQSLTENFILDYFDKNWSEILQLDQHNVNLSMDSYLGHMNAILDIHAPYKKVNKYKVRCKIRPWITPALQKSVTVKNHLLKKFINCNDSQTKEQLHTRYEEYRNLLSTLSKRSKINYYYNHYILIGATLKILGKE